MLDVNKSDAFLFSGRIDALVSSVKKVDPLLHKSMEALENVLIQEEERRQEYLDQIEAGVVMPDVAYEFDEEEFLACIPRVLIMLKARGEIPEDIKDMFERSKYADDWYVFCNALCMHAISCDMPQADVRTDPVKSLEALSNIIIDEDFVQKYLRPHSITLYRYDEQSVYKNISKDLSLPVVVLTEGIMTYRLSVATSYSDVWWYNILDEAHSRWESILGAAMDFADQMGGVDPQEAG